MQELETFGLHIRQMRKSLGFTQEHLAELTGLHRTYVGSIERGERNISLNNILRLSEALECDPSELLTCFDET